MGHQIEIFHLSGTFGCLRDRLNSRVIENEMETAVLRSIRLGSFALYEERRLKTSSSLQIILDSEGLEMGFVSWKIELEDRGLDKEKHEVKNAFSSLALSTEEEAEVV